MPRNKKRSGAVFLQCLHTTTIEYDTKNMVWKLKEHSKNVTATTDAPLASYVMGAQQWMVQNDKRECFNEIQPSNKVCILNMCHELLIKDICL